MWLSLDNVPPSVFFVHGTSPTRSDPQWLVSASEAIQTPATSSSSMTYSCAAGSAVVFSSSSVSGASASWTVTAIYGSGNSHQTGDSFTVSVAASAIVDLAGNAMSASMSSTADNAVTFGPSPFLLRLFDHNNLLGRQLGACLELGCFRFFAARCFGRPCVASDHE